MKKFLLSMALVLLSGATMAQSALEKGNIVSVATLKSSTTSQKIAIKNIDSKNNYWFSATKNNATLTSDDVFYWEPVEGSTTLFYLKKACYPANEGYVILTNNATSQGGGAKSLGLGSKENAIKLQAETPNYGGTPVDDADKNNIVRFYNEDKSNWINCELSTENPSFRNNPGTGTFTIHNVYDMNAYKLLTINFVKDGTTTTEYQLHKEGESIIVPSYEGYNSDYTATTKDATDTQEITVNYSIVEEEPLVKTGQLYTINLTPGYTAADRAGASMYVHSDAKLRCNKITGNVAAENVFVFEEGADGNIYMKNIATQTYISGIGANASQDAILANSETTENAMEVSFGELGEKTVDGNTVKIIEIQPGNHAMLNCAEIYSSTTKPGRVVSFTPGSDKINKASAWYFTEVSEFSHTLAVGTTEWATLVLGFTATIPTNDGFKAYTIESIEGTTVNLAEATGVLAANTPIIVNAPQGDYTFAYTTDEATVAANGKLCGTLYNKNISEEAYVLGIPNGETEAVLGKAGMSNGVWLNNANKAYLPATAVPTAAQGIASFSFRYEGTTSIEEVETENAVKAIYDLTGRKVEVITAPGIYIVGGKKVLVK